MELVVGASSDAVKSLVGKLGSLLAQEYTLIRGVRDDIQFINDELASMQAFLNRLKRGSSHDEQGQDWMKQVREVAYDIEDCIGDISHRLDREPRGSKLIRLRRAWYLLTTLYVRRGIATEIGNLKLRAQHVSDRRKRYGVEIIPKDDGSKPVGTDASRDVPTPTPKLIGTKEPVGIEDGMKEAKRWLDEGKHNPQLRFFAIFGFGGLGKTTLAMAVYRKFGDDFDCRASVQASQKFNLLALLRSLIKQFHEQRKQQAGASETPLDGIDELREERLKSMLADQLKAKRVTRRVLAHLPPQAHPRWCQTRIDIRDVIHSLSRRRPRKDRIELKRSTQRNKLTYNIHYNLHPFNCINMDTTIVSIIGDAD